jgi:hypothetical protein
MKKKPLSKIGNNRLQQLAILYDIAKNENESDIDQKIYDRLIDEEIDKLCSKME